MCENHTLGRVFALITNTHRDAPLSRIVLGAESTDVRGPRPCPWGETVETTVCTASPKGRPGRKGGACGFYADRGRVCLGASRPQPGLNHPGCTAVRVLEKSLREPETRTGGFISRKNKNKSP